MQHRDAQSSSDSVKRPLFDFGIEWSEPWRFTSRYIKFRGESRATEWGQDLDTVQWVPVSGIVRKRYGWIAGTPRLDWSEWR